MSTEPYVVVANQLRTAAEAAAELWQQGALALTEQAESLTKLPLMDPSAGIQQYFALLTNALEANRELATQWAGAVSSMTEVIGQRWNALADAAQSQLTSAVDSAELVPEPSSDLVIPASAELVVAPSSDVVVGDPADLIVAHGTDIPVVEPADLIVVDSTEPFVGEHEHVTVATPGTVDAAAKVVAATEDVDPEQARELARSSYLGMTKTELTKTLISRKLPKSGTVEQLVSRLVAADLAQ